MRRYLRDKGFGYLQNSVWITPDPLLPGRILSSDYLGQQAWRFEI